MPGAAAGTWRAGRFARPFVDRAALAVLASRRELSVGRGSTAPVGGGAFPAISDREPWDGKDGEVSPRGGPRACPPSVSLEPRRDVRSVVAVDVLGRDSGDTFQ